MKSNNNLPLDGYRLDTEGVLAVDEMWPIRRFINWGVATAVVSIALMWPHSGNEVSADVGVEVCDDAERTGVTVHDEHLSYLQDSIDRGYGQTLYGEYVDVDHVELADLVCISPPGTLNEGAYVYTSSEGVQLMEELEFDLELEMRGYPQRLEA